MCKETTQTNPNDGTSITTFSSRMYTAFEYNPYNYCSILASSPEKVKMMRPSPPFTQGSVENQWREWTKQMYR